MNGRAIFGEIEPCSSTKPTSDFFNMLSALANSGLAPVVAESSEHWLSQKPLMIFDGPEAEQFSLGSVP
jgi:hypothetical protein